MQNIQEFGRQIVENIEKVIVGKTDVVETLVLALLCEGHVLLEDVPGVGKTMLARALALSLGVDFRRLQCTPDLLPSDITGVSVFNQQTREFQFVPGPAFTHVLLADEINRATPRAQAALLVHGRTSDHGRRRDSHPAKALSGAGDSEPGGVRGNVSLAGSPVGPISV